VASRSYYNVGGREQLARLVREPFIHFLVIGALLFVVFAVVGDQRPTRGNRIDITAADVEQLRSIFASRWGRAPTPTELRGLIEDRIREEVLYREALALGLDKDDTIVRRRLIQKLEFLVADVGALAEPDEAALKAYYARHPERYREPARLSFSQVYFSTDKGGARAPRDAAALLRRLQAAKGPSARAAEQGDRSTLEQDYVEHGTDEIARDFGPAFAEALARLPVGVWQGPVTSGYGIHLVYISARTEPRLPELGEVRERVARDLLVEQRRAANERVFEGLRSSYQITLPDAPGVEIARGEER